MSWLQLGGDRVADLAHLGQARQPRAEALDRLELGRPGGHPAERPRRADGDRGVARQGLRRVEVDLAPAVRRGRGRGRATPWSSWPSTSGAMSSVSTPSWTAAARIGLAERGASGPSEERPAGAAGFPLRVRAALEVAGDGEERVREAGCRRAS